MRLYCDAVTYNGIGTFDMYEPVWHGGQASIALMIAAALPELEAVSSSLKSSAGMWVQWVLNNLETESRLLISQRFCSVLHIAPATAFSCSLDWMRIVYALLTA